MHRRSDHNDARRRPLRIHRSGVEAFVRSAGIEIGLLTLFVRHTSCSLLIQENADPDVRRDLDAFFRRLVPPADDPAMDYLVHRLEGPDDMPAHIKAALTAASLSVPVMDGRPGARHVAGHLPVRASRDAASAESGAASVAVR